MSRCIGCGRQEDLRSVTVKFKGDQWPVMVCAFCEAYADRWYRRWNRAIATSGSSVPQFGSKTA